MNFLLCFTLAQTAEKGHFPQPPDKGRNQLKTYSKIPLKERFVIKSNQCKNPNKGHGYKTPLKRESALK